MASNKNKKPVKTSQRVLFLIIALVTAFFISINVSTIGGTKDKNNFSLSTSTQGTYVIEDLNVRYIYDKTKYEIVSLSQEPYAIVKGDKQLINILKWGKDKPDFYIDLTGKKPGTYREQIQYKGISSKLDVELYSPSLDLRVVEQETATFVPVVELVGAEGLPSDLIVGVPKVNLSEVKIRDIQERLNQVGQVKAVLNISDLRETTTTTINLIVYDREGKEMEGVNLLNKVVDVTVPIEPKTTIINKEEVKKYVNSDKVSVKEHKEQKHKEPKKEEVEHEEEPKEEIKEHTNKKAKGSLKYIGLKKGYTLTDKTREYKWTSNIVINISSFKEGVYSMVITDDGVKRKISFLIKKDSTGKEPVKDTEVIKPSTSDKDKEEKPVKEDDKEIEDTEKPQQVTKPNKEEKPSEEITPDSEEEINISED